MRCFALFLSFLWQPSDFSTVAFMKGFAVPFDTNRAERDLRMMKVKQKSGGMFPHPTGARTSCRIRSYTPTMKKQGHTVPPPSKASF